MDCETFHYYLFIFRERFPEDWKWLMLRPAHPPPPQKVSPLEFMADAIRHTHTGRAEGYAPSGQASYRKASGKYLQRPLG